MSNAIDLKIGEENNAMQTLSFYWRAEFENGDTIEQFKDGIENRFKEVQDRFPDLKFFYLYHKEKPIKFIVDLKKGLIFNDPSQEQVCDFNHDKHNIRLIYKRRVRRYLSDKLQQMGCDIWYLLGIQYNDNNGYNRKFILQINGEGNFILGD